jgi:hypothetical protein
VRLYLRPLGVRQNESVHPELESQTAADENPKSQQTLDHDEFGLNQSKLIVIDSKMLARDAGGKPGATFPHPALEHRAQKCVRFCARTMLYHFESGAFC